MSIVTTIKARRKVKNDTRFTGILLDEVSIHEEPTTQDTDMALFIRELLEIIDRGE